MLRDDSSWLSDAADLRSNHIREARAQAEAARLRQLRLLGPEWLAEPAPGACPLAASPPGYTILHELHRGGQGIVYLAVQRSTGRRVAIKLLNYGSPLGPSAAGLARFEREVEALSLLKHSNVVTIHDCGRDRDHVYLVMDYVDGRPLDRWIDANRPSIRDILSLFAQVCDGVNAAHLRGVIHRDLKPGNILVDEHGKPRILDFGLAKLVDDAASSASSAAAMTVTGQFVGSLPWASPEQAEGRGDQLDIRTDVYSLGVVLYQLLTGGFPYRVTGRLAEVVRHIAQSEPIRPSAIQPGIGRDVETILLKCLAKEPDRRYQSAGELAGDIRRYLAGEPIGARRDSFGYLLARQIVRHRVAAVAAGLALSAVLCALFVSLALWRHAERQKGLAQRSAAAALESARRADDEADQARSVVEFMREVLTSVEPRNHGADVRLIQVLAGASDTASRRFAAHPRQEAQVHDLLGQVYDTLSMWAEAGAEFQRAAELWSGSAGPDDPLTLEARLKRLRVLINQTRAGEAEHVLADLLPRLERVFGPEDPRTLAARRHLAATYLFRGYADDAERVLNGLRAHPAVAGDDAALVPVLGVLVAVCKQRLDTDDEGRRRAVLAAAEPLAREWVERSTRLLGPEDTVTYQARGSWADLACGLGWHQAAADECRDILGRSSGRLGECHFIRTNTMFTLAEALSGLGDDHEPAELMLRRIECLRRLVEPESPLFLASLSDALWYLDRGGRMAEGETLARELTANLRKLGGGHGDMVFQSELFVAHFVSAQHRLDEAEPLFGGLLARAESVSDHITRARLHALYGSHLARRGRFDDAERQLRLAAELLDGTRRPYPDDVIREFIFVYEACGKPAQAAEYHALREVSLQR